LGVASASVADLFPDSAERLALAGVHVGRRRAGHGGGAVVRRLGVPSTASWRYVFDANLPVALVAFATRPGWTACMMRAMAKATAAVLAGRGPSTMAVCGPPFSAGVKPGPWPAQRAVSRAVGRHRVADLGVFAAPVPHAWRRCNPARCDGQRRVARRLTPLSAGSGTTVFSLAFDTPLLLQGSFHSSPKSGRCDDAVAGLHHRGQHRRCAHRAPAGAAPSA